MGKTKRFGDLVRNSGRPRVVTLWVDPEKDSSFSKAIVEHRVLTVHADPASHKKEHGSIGFQKEQGASYLVFPRPLPKEQARIVGINYSLTEEPPLPAKDLISRAHLKPRKKEKPEAKMAKVEKPLKAEPPKLELKTFDLVVCRTAVLEQTERIKAANEEAAKEACLANMKTKSFNVSRAKVRIEILSTTEKAI
jgi:hypothetical protein